MPDELIRDLMLRCNCNGQRLPCLTCRAVSEIERLKHENSILRSVVSEEGRANRMTLLYESAQAKIQSLQDAGDSLAIAYRTLRWFDINYDTPLQCWEDIRGD